MVINRIAEQHADRFIWFYLLDGDALLVFDDKRTPKSGVEIQFTVWGNGVREINLIACHKHDMDEPDSRNFLMDWDLDKIPLETITNELFTLLDTYLTKDFIKLWDVPVTIIERDGFHCPLLYCDIDANKCAEVQQIRAGTREMYALGCGQFSRARAGKLCKNCENKKEG